MDSILVRSMIHSFSVTHLKKCSTTVPIKLKPALENIIANLRYGHLYEGFLLLFYLTYFIFSQSYHHLEY